LDSGFFASGFVPSGYVGSEFCQFEVCASWGGRGAQKPGCATTTPIAAHPQTINTALIPISNFRG
jgi:hypothetical protein